MLSLNAPALHSNEGAAKVIYLDFDGQQVRSTPWNTDTGFGNIDTLPFSTDTDYGSFSDPELAAIQSIWERVSEDFLPFNVDVTTVDPGMEALKHTGGNDTKWGIRVVIGGSTNDWYSIAHPTATAPSQAISGSFYSQVPSGDNDTSAFVFSADLATGPIPLDKKVAETVSHVVGKTLGLKDAKQLVTNPNPPPPLKGVPYAGHGVGPTSWAPIMGDGTQRALTQWSFFEFPFADVPEDELAAITDPQTGVSYRTDDHGSTLATADPLPIDPDGIDTELNLYFADGIIERNTDKDIFSFTVEGLGEIVSFDISPVSNGPNLDILATLSDSSGTVIGTSNPVHILAAGGQTFGGTDPDGGWLDENGDYVDEFSLGPGTYYLSIEGAAKAIEQTNPTDPSTIDWGYTNYGSLGAYSISGTRIKELVVGVDFDTDPISPYNWNFYSGGGSSDQLTDLISEAGTDVPYTLSINSSGPAINTYFENAIDSADLPNRTLSLEDLDGFIAAQDETLTFVWGNLQPATVYQIYVFGHDDVAAKNVVTVSGGQWNGQTQIYNFTQNISPDGLVINNTPSGTEELSTRSLLVISDDLGQITINVTNQAGYEAGLAGLAIAPTKVGSISGQKWNDLDGNQTFDPTELGLAGWIIYLDLDNNHDLNRDFMPDQVHTEPSPDHEQPIPDANPGNVGIKSELNFPDSGQILDVNVKLDIAHTYDSDLHVFLTSPQGTTIALFENIGPSGVNFHNTILDDSATISIDSPQASAPYTGSFQPQQSLSAFINQEAHGTWTLEIYDDTADDTGSLISWEIEVKVKGFTVYNEPFAITNASGNYTFVDQQPGLYYVREYIQPQQLDAGWRQTWAPAPVTLRSGANFQGVDFGNWIPIPQAGSIHGQKFYDANQDGVKDPQEHGLPGWIVYIDANNNHVRDTTAAPVNYASADVPKLIPDQQTVTSQVTVNTLGTILDVDVTLDISHSFVGDLNLFLTSPGPSGKKIKLIAERGGQYADFHGLILDDSANRSITTLGVNDLPYTGRWRPEEPLSDFNGQDAFGTWTLELQDIQENDQGTLNSWSLTITTGEVFRTTPSDGTYEFDNLLAGQYVVREEPQTGAWTQIPPTTTDIPAAIWDDSLKQWNVTVVAIDDFTDPIAPDSHRNVQNVDFGNYGAAGSIHGQVYKDVDGNSAKAPGEPGLPNWTVFVDSQSTGTPGTLDLGTVDDTAVSNVAKAINNAFPVSSKLWFGEIGSITDVDVSLNITHTYDSDLTVNLVSPAGTRVNLFTGVGANGQNFTNTTFDDSAAQPISAGTAPFSNTFTPAGFLSAFNGENSVGFWTLEIIDGSPASDGSLNSWSLAIKGDELSTKTLSDGSYSFGNLPPGVYSVATVQKPVWVPTEHPGSVSVTVSPGQNVVGINFGNKAPALLEGDFTRDGVVDGADYVMWRRTLGSTVTNFSGADGDGSGVVDLADLAVWRAHFGEQSLVGGSGGEALAAAPASNSALQVESAALPVAQAVQLATVVEPLTGVVASTASLKAPILVTQAFPLAAGATALTHDSLVVDSPAESAAPSDLGLMAWIAASSQGDRPQADFSFSDGNFAASSSSHVSESLDAAFEMLEGSALAAAAI